MCIRDRDSTGRELSDEVKDEVGKRVSLRFRTYFAFPQFEITVPYLILHSGIFMLQKC